MVSCWFLSTMLFRFVTSTGLLVQDARCLCSFSHQHHCSQGQYSCWDQELPWGEIHSSCHHVEGCYLQTLWSEGWVHCPGQWHRAGVKIRLEQCFLVHWQTCKFSGNCRLPVFQFYSPPPPPKKKHRHFFLAPTRQNFFRPEFAILFLSDIAGIFFRPEIASILLYWNCLHIFRPKISGINFQPEIARIFSTRNWGI